MPFDGQWNILLIDDDKIFNIWRRVDASINNRKIETEW